jgi:hypothetical protein
LSRAVRTLLPGAPRRTRTWPYPEVLALAENVDARNLYNNP